jgi:hypothetical protein
MPLFASWTLWLQGYMGSAPCPGLTVLSQKNVWALGSVTPKGTRGPTGRILSLDSETCFVSDVGMDDTIPGT